MDDLIQQIDWEKMKGLIPVIVQEYSTSEVLMLGFMDKTALQRTLEYGKVTYWSRSKQRLWTKGETSGNFQLVKEIWLDCDADTLLIKAEQIGCTCHTGNPTCFFREFYGNKNK